MRTDTPPPTVSAVNWSNCFLCEQVTDEKLICPLDHAYGGDGYKTLAKNLPALHGLGRLPSSLKLDCFDDGDGLESTFMQRHAKYHKSCSLKYNEKNLQRAIKRKSGHESSHEMPEKFTRQNISQFYDTTGLFCNKPETSSKPLCNSSTDDLDTRVKQCVINLQDQPLLVRLSRADAVSINMKYHPQCLVALYNRDRAQLGTSQKNTPSGSAGNTAFAELLSYMQDIMDS